MTPRDLPAVPADPEEAPWPPAPGLGPKAPDLDLDGEAAEPSAPSPHTDPVWHYLREIGRIPLLTPAEEAALARRLAAARLDLQRALAALPAARTALQALVEKVERGALPPEALFADTDGGEAGSRPAQAAAASRRLRQLRRALAAGGAPDRPRRPSTAALRQLLARAPLHPLVLDRLVTACRTAPRRGARARRRLAEVEARLAAVREARHAFAAANLRLVVALATRSRGRGLELSDLIQAGNLGLLKAVDRFQVQRGCKFSTYATWWIRQGITRALETQTRTIRLPVHVGEQLARLRHAEEALTQRLGRAPTPAEVTQTLGLRPAQAEALLAAGAPAASLDAPAGEDAVLGDLLADPETAAPDAVAARREAAARVRQLLDTLRPRERDVLRLRFGLDGDAPQTLEQIGRRFGLTRERIRQLERTALGRLRHPRRRQILAPFAET